MHVIPLHGAKNKHLYGLDMGLENPRYSFLLLLQLLLLAVDMLCNSFAILLGNSTITLVVLFIVQDTALIGAQVVLLLSFFNTFAFTAGLLNLILKKFMWALVFGGVYLLVSIGYHVWLVVTRWSSPVPYSWTGWLQAMYAIQKLVAVCYYYMHTRAAYRLSDPRYYGETEWMKTHMRR